MSHRCISGMGGFTLLETMIALLIFSVGVLGVAGLQVQSMHNDGIARRATRLSVAASKSLETILALPYDDPLLGDPDDGYVPSNPDHGPFGIKATESTVEWEVDDQFPTPNTKRIRITVRINGHTGGSQVFSYDYIKAKGFV